MTCCTGQHEARRPRGLGKEERHRRIHTLRVRSSLHGHGPRDSVVLAREQAPGGRTGWAGQRRAAVFGHLVETMLPKRPRKAKREDFLQVALEGWTSGWEEARLNPTSHQP